MSGKQILIIDDEEAVCWSLKRAFERAGHRVAVASSAEEGLIEARRSRPDAVILDVRLPGADGLSILGELHEITSNAPIVVVTAHGNLSTAIRAVEGGAFDYLAKPFDLTQALEVVTRALDRPQPGVAKAETVSVLPEEIIGRSAAMQRVFKQIALVAPREAGVLISGESGTGKELVARAIHRHSARHEKPFIPVHVAAMNPNLVESELFGHVKGAFTGANENRSGLLSLANGGTAFLDEVADIPLPVQAKLLRVLEYNEVFPVGGNQAQSLNLRLLSASHQDLARAVERGTFRHDLFFRLNGFQIQLPSLRDRGDDVLDLAEHFIRTLEPRSWPLPPVTAQFLKSRPWPGNVRELRHALEHACIIARGSPLLPEHFPPPSTQLHAADTPSQLSALLRRWVRERVAAAGEIEPANLYAELLTATEPAVLSEVLELVDGNRLAASRWLGLARATVRKMIARHLPEVASSDDENGKTGDEDSPGDHLNRPRLN
jgi:two-component system, NtrC family, nitrogen regulation response regulator GlnG